MKDLRKQAAMIGNRDAPDFPTDTTGRIHYSNEYLGILRTYYVNGPLKTDAVLGYTSFPGVKTESEAQGDLATDAELKKIIREAHRRCRQRDFIITLIYLITGNSLPAHRRQMAYISLLVRGTKPDQILKRATQIANSSDFKKRAFRGIQGKSIEKHAKFIGICDVEIPSLPIVKLGYPLEACSRTYKHASSVKRLLPDQSRLEFPIFR